MNINNINKHPLFVDYSEDHLQTLLEKGDAFVKKFEKSEIVFFEGDPADKVGIVLSGSVQVEKFDYDGNHSIFANLSEGELFAEAFAFSEVEFMTVAIRAVEPSEILFLYNEAVDSDYTLARNMLHFVAKKMFLFDQRIEVISRRKTRNRLLLYLQQQAELNHNNTFIIPYNRQELADYLGVDRSGLSVEINRLIREKKLIANGSHFEIKVRIQA